MSQDYTTIRVTESAKAKAEQNKREDETWNDYVLRCAENPPEVREFVDKSQLTISLEASERRKIAEEVAGNLR